MAGRIIALLLWLAHPVQAAMAAAATVMVYRVFRGEGEWHLKIALLFVATLVASSQGSIPKHFDRDSFRGSPS